MDAGPQSRPAPPVFCTQNNRFIFSNHETDHSYTCTSSESSPPVAMARNTNDEEDEDASFDDDDDDDTDEEAADRSGIE